MRLYNTLSRQLEDVTPLQGSKMRMYSCGPTVYDHAHIGNLSSFIFADTLRRSMQIEYEVKHVMNFTDVDDKTIARSRERYPDVEPRQALQTLTDHYIDVFLEDIRAIGNDTAAMTFIRATDAIEQMQALIRLLHARGFAYVADDGVYFSITAYRRAGKTYGQLTPVTVNSTAEARINNDEYDKADAQDFALWKTQKSDEPAWSFELNGHDVSGRPGWHIECSAMSTELLGQPFDIHSGGIDLIFPHHENEIAQSTAAGDNSYAAIFAHNEHLLVDGKKMSKSLNNFYTLEDVRQRGFEPLAFRLLVLQAHYRHQAQFSWENLQAAQNRLRDLQAMAVLRYQPQATSNATVDLAALSENLSAALLNDLDAPAALAIASELSNQLQAELVSSSSLEEFTSLLQRLDDLLGLQLLQVPDISGDHKQLIAAREAARAAKNWDEADRLRDALAGEGIALRDTPQGAIWYCP